ncbi:hypothetical protein BDQ17DRAFT_1426969 [Cyathus striatus]|nr:hypothetical protein BDQ17DRAFT_1426969 [Cyathus striatus]
MVRFENRWLLIELIPVDVDHMSRLRPSHLDAKTIYVALCQSVIYNLGDTGWGAMGLSLTVKYFSPMTNICIIRVVREQHKITWGAVTLLTSIEGIKYIQKVVHPSGSIKHVQRAAIAYNKFIVAGIDPMLSLLKDSYDNYLESSEKEIEMLQDLCVLHIFQDLQGAHCNAPGSLG